MTIRTLLAFALFSTVVFGFEEPSAEPPTQIAVSALDLSRLTTLEAEEETAQTLLRAIASERQQIRLNVCLREAMKATECGPLNRNPDGSFVVFKFATKPEKAADQTPKVADPKPADKADKPDTAKPEKQ